MNEMLNVIKENLNINSNKATKDFVSKLREKLETKMNVKLSNEQLEHVYKIAFKRYDDASYRYSCEIEDVQDLEQALIKTEVMPYMTFGDVKTRIEIEVVQLLYSTHKNLMLNHKEKVRKIIEESISITHRPNMEDLMERIKAEIKSNIKEETKEKSELEKMFKEDPIKEELPTVGVFRDDPKSPERIELEKMFKEDPIKEELPTVGVFRDGPTGLKEPETYQEGIEVEGVFKDYSRKIEELKKMKEELNQKEELSVEGIFR